VKIVAEFHQKAKEAIDKLIQTQLQESDHHENEVMLKFEESLKETHSKELKQKIKERKVKDKQDLINIIGDKGLSQVDEEIMKEKQKIQRKEYKKELKREIETNLRAIVEKKEI